MGSQFKGLVESSFFLIRKAHKARICGMRKSGNNDKNLLDPMKMNKENYKNEKAQEIPIPIRIKKSWYFKI